VSLRFLVVMVVVVLTSVVAVKLLSPTQRPILGTIDLQKALSDDSGQFADVFPGRRFTFPRDHGEHPEFKTEWWYFTGNLSDEVGQRFGYQITLFRIGLATNERMNNPSQWSADSILMGHFALSDVGSQEFYSYERFARRSLGLAGVEPNGAKIWLEDWAIRRLEKGWAVTAEAVENERTVEVDLTLTDTKSPVLQGDSGYSRKGPEPRHASYYVSQTRLKTQGQVRIGDRSHKVVGHSWFDHEWSTASMADGLVGWDWFSLQLDDSSELMLYLLRYPDGRLEPASSGASIDPDGTKRNLQLKDFSVEKKGEYRSPRGVVYPSRWLITIPQSDLRLEVRPMMSNQEMTGGVPYWEGAVEVTGRRGEEPISGSGFVELTGYSDKR
jgi:predicted secreted hydrolase